MQLVLGEGIDGCIGGKGGSKQVGQDEGRGWSMTSILKKLLGATTRTI